MLIHYSLLFIIYCRYNNLNIDQILSNERLVTNYVECLLSRKPCTPEGKDLKRKSVLIHTRSNLIDKFARHGNPYI